VCWQGRWGWGLGHGYLNAVDDEPPVTDDESALLRGGAVCAGLHFNFQALVRTLCSRSIQTTGVRHSLRLSRLHCHRHRPYEGAFPEHFVYHPKRYTETMPWCPAGQVACGSVWLVGHWWATLETNGSGEQKEGYGAQVLFGAREADGLVAHMW